MFKESRSSSLYQAVDGPAGDGAVARYRKGWALLVLLLGLLGGSALWYASQEIDAIAYRSLRDAFKAGAPSLKASIAAGMRDGHVSRWEFYWLAKQGEKEHMTFTAATASLNLAEERLVLAAMTRQVPLP